MSVASVVCNASPLITLAKADLLEIVPNEFSKAVMPAAVVVEIVAGPQDDPMRASIDALQWLDQVELKPPLSPLAYWRLGRGESEVIEYARLHQGTVALLDDKNARRTAEALAVPVLGTLGLVARAFGHGHIQSIQDAANRLRKAGLFLDEGVIAAVTKALKSR